MGVRLNDRGAAAILLGVGLLLLACRPPEQATRSEATPSTANPAVAPSTPQRQTVVARRDLAIDESMGGHTLQRHVGRTDAELAERLRHEPQISAASSYTDRSTAEHAVAAALAKASSRVTTWEQRTGRRPNLVLNYTDPAARQPLGRSLRRGQRQSRPAARAIVVLRWHERSNRFYVLTSYPEADR